MMLAISNLYWLLYFTPRDGAHQLDIKQFNKLLAQNPHLWPSKSTIFFKNAGQIPSLEFSEASDDCSGAMSALIAPKIKIRSYMTING